MPLPKYSKKKESRRGRLALIRKRVCDGLTSKRREGNGTRGKRASASVGQRHGERGLGQSVGTGKAVVKKHDTAAAQLSPYTPDDGLARLAPRVERPDAPPDHRMARLPDYAAQEMGAYAQWRTEKHRTDATGRLYNAVSPPDVGEQPSGPEEIGPWRVAICVIANDMATADYLADEFGVSLGLGSYDKEYGTVAILVEDVEDSGRDVRVGTVVESQEDGLPVRDGEWQAAAVGGQTANGLGEYAAADVGRAYGEKGDSAAHDYGNNDVKADGGHSVRRAKTL